MSELSKETLHHMRTAWHALLVLMLEHPLAALHALTGLHRASHAGG